MGIIWKRIWQGRRKEKWKRIWQGRRPSLALWCCHHIACGTGSGVTESVKDLKSETGSGIHEAKYMIEDTPRIIPMHSRWYELLLNNSVKKNIRTKISS